MNQVSFGTVIPCIGREVQDTVSRFGQNHWKSPYYGFIWEQEEQEPLFGKINVH